MSSLSYVQSVSGFDIVADHTAQPPISRPGDENVGCMGKSPVNSCIPGRFDYCTVTDLHLVSLLTPVGGLCGAWDCDNWS